jgi:hypothetical protein
MAGPRVMCEKQRIRVEDRVGLSRMNSQPLIHVEGASSAQQLKLDGFQATSLTEAERLVVAKELRTEGGSNFGTSSTGGLRSSSCHPKVRDQKTESGFFSMVS